jgi:hypothetical protein
MTLLTGVAIWAVVWTAYNIFEVDNTRVSRHDRFHVSPSFRELTWMETVF